MDAVALAAHVAGGLPCCLHQVVEIERLALDYHFTQEGVARHQARVLGALDHKLPVSQVPYHALAARLPGDKQTLVD